MGFREHKLRKKANVLEINKCYLCNNKAQLRCKKCHETICNDCKSKKNNLCYKCDVVELQEPKKQNKTAMYFMMFLFIFAIIPFVTASIPNNIISNNFENNNFSISNNGISATYQINISNTTTSIYEGNHSVKIATTYYKNGLWFPYQFNYDKNFTICVYMNITAPLNDVCDASANYGALLAIDDKSSQRFVINGCNGFISLTIFNNTPAWSNSYLTMTPQLNKWLPFCVSYSYNSANNVNYTLYYNNLTNSSINSKLYDNTYSTGVSIGNPSGTASITQNTNTFFDCLAVFNQTINTSQMKDWQINCVYPFEPANTSNTFINQSPTNITVLNILGSPLNITYKINDSNKLNNTPFINYTITNGTIYVNGSNFSSNGQRIYFDTTDNITYLFQLYETDIYPAVYNINQSIMENTDHNTYISNGASSMMKVQLLNVSTNKNYNIFEVMANVNTTGLAMITYCNSSYITGNPNSNNNCVQFGTITTSSYNHISKKSKHNILSMPLINGSLGGVKITPTSYFIISRQSGNVQVGYINGSARVNNTMTTVNTGNSYTDQNWTADLHIHQYDGTEILNFNECYNTTTTAISCTSTYSQTIGLTNLPPSVGYVNINDTNLYYNETILSTWNNATPSINTSKINNYALDLYNDSDNFIKTLSSNASNNSYSFIIQSIPIGNYYLLLTATDNNSISATSTSNYFSVNNNIISPCNQTIVLNSTGVIVNFNYSYDNLSLAQIIFGNTLFGKYQLANTTGNNTLINIGSATYKLSLESDYSLYNTSYSSSCTLTTCQSQWLQTLQPCTGNLRLVSYNDANNCSVVYDLPSNNGTYIDCVSPPNTDKDLWFIIILIFVWVITLIITLVYMPLMGMLSALAGLGLGYYCYLYFGNPFLGIIAFMISSIAIFVGMSIKR